MESKNSKEVKKVEVEEEKKESPAQVSSTQTKPSKHKILFYRERDAFGFMSNFYKSPVFIDGKSWPTTEHYFQAMKFPSDPDYMEKIRANASCVVAKRSGKRRTGFR